MQAGRELPCRGAAARGGRVRPLPPVAVPEANTLSNAHQGAAARRERDAVRLGVSFPRLNEIVRGKRSVTPDTALRLERVLGMSAGFWLGLQTDWDLWHAMRSASADEIERLEPLTRTA